MGYLKHLNPDRWIELVDIGMAYTLHECALDTVLYVYGVFADLGLDLPSLFSFDGHCDSSHWLR